ncbi:hypothetical protein [Mesorhizobium sp. B3-2-1]|nr:hypothetical protein [Mesorhizobium sp. B3-2-1]
MARFVPEEMLPGTQYDSDEDLTRKAGNIDTAIFHPVEQTIGQDS